MSVHIALSGHLGIGRIDEVVRRLAPLHSASSSTEVVLDLGDLLSISAPALALVVAALRDALARDVPAPLARYVAPHAPGLRRLLSKRALEDLVTRTATPGPPAARAAALSDTCAHFADGECATRVAIGLGERLQEQADLPDNTKCAIQWMIGDFADNVLDHATTHSGVAAVGADRERREVYVAVADCGIGIRSSLSKNPDLADLLDDRAAVAKALEAQVTSEPGTGGGIGLFYASQLVHDNGGTMIVRSGGGAARYVRGIEALGGLDHLPGTLVVATIRTDSPLDLEHVEVRLTKPEGIATRR